MGSVKLYIGLTCQAIPNAVQPEAGRRHRTQLVEDISTSDFVETVTHSDSKLQHVAVKGEWEQIDLGRHFNEVKWGV